MSKLIGLVHSVLLLAALVAPAWGAESGAGPAPWGTAQSRDIDYAPQKVLYDVTSGDGEFISQVLDRVSYLSQLYDADPFAGSIVVIIHGDAIKHFAIENYRKNEKLMKRAQSLTVGNIIEFRLCRAAARLQGYGPEDIHGFVTLVPMADAEIVRLQQEEGYAYMK